jgi:hypothetical protein
VLAHNVVVHGPDWPVDINGFRAWTATQPPPGFVLCPCGYAGLEHYADADFVQLCRKDPGRYWRKVRAIEDADPELLEELLVASGELAPRP